MKVDDVAKNNPQVANWFLAGLRAAGYRKMVAIVDVEKGTCRLLTWPLEGTVAAIADVFVRGVMTNAPTEDDNDDQGE